MMDQSILEPCRHMERLLNELASGKLQGLPKAYAVYHAAKCHQCGTFLKRLQITLQALRSAQEAEVNSEAIERLRSRLATL